MQHSVPENTEPTMAKFRPEDKEERYMSRRPARSCWRRGRSVRGTEVGGWDSVVVAAFAVEAVAVDVADVAEDESVDFAADAVAAFAAGFVGGTAFTGRGWDIGVSYLI